MYNYQNFNFDSTLVNWANQGVLMLNTALTVEKGKAGSHASLWNNFTTLFLKKLSEHNSGIIYCLWGNYAKNYSKYINSNSNTILTYKHPAASAYNHQPWECDHFEKVNSQLKSFNNFTIKW